MGMTTIDLFSYGNDLRQRGNIQGALQIWADISSKDPLFAPVHINLADIYRQQGNSKGEHEELLKFMNSPQTGITMKLIPNVEARIQELEGKKPMEKK